MGDAGEINKVMRGFWAARANGNEFMSRQSWYDPNAEENLKRLQQISLHQQMIKILQDKWEAAKKSKVKGPEYNILAYAAELAAKYPISGRDTTRIDNRAEYAQKVNKEKYEQLGLFAPGYSYESNWKPTFDEIDSSIKRQKI